MVTIGMYYDVIPGKEELFQDKCNAVISALNGSAGHKQSFLYRRVDDASSFAILSEWDDQDAFLRFIRSEDFKQVTAWGREQILRNAPRHKIYPRSEDMGPKREG